MNNRRGGTLVRVALLVGLLLFALVPIWLTIVVSLDPSQRLSATSIVPKAVSFDNYRTVMSGETFPFWRWTINSLVIATTSSVLLVVLCCFGAYAFSRIRFKGRHATLSLMFAVNTVPPLLSLLALFGLVRALGDQVSWLGFNSRIPLVVIYVASGLVVNTWLMKGFFDALPRDIDEAARLDGANHWQIFVKILLPLARPMIAVVGVLGFIAFFNDYIIALTFLKEPDSQTLAVGLNNFIGANSTQWGFFSAGAIIASIPVVGVVLWARRHIVDGLTGGSTKG